MDIETARKRAGFLRREIEKHNRLYFSLDMPVLPDAQYDALFRELQDIESAFPQIVAPDSPTQRVGAPPLSKFQKVPHKRPMLSLANVFNTAELMDFDKRVKKALGMEGDIEYAAEPKIDGLGISLTYKDGVFVRGATRGDGITGEDVTVNLKTIKSLPLRLSGEKGHLPPEIEVRGEVYMKIKDFEDLNASRERSGEPQFANPRNAAAGSLRQLDSSVTAKRRLDIFCYEAGNIKGMEFKEHTEILSVFRNWGLPVNPLIRKVKGAKEAAEAYREIMERRDTLDYEIDGVVIKVDSMGLRRKLGAVSRCPRWAVAYKFPPAEKTTKVINIIAQVGRTGVITPVAVMEPVTLCGVTISRATLHNQDEIDKKDIRIGDTVVVRRAGDVIPEVVSPLKEKRTGAEKKYRLPARCPACGSSALREEGEAVYRCVGIGCPARLVESVAHFVSRGAMNIEGLGPKLIEQMVKQGIVKTPLDIYRISKEDILNLDRTADKSASNLIGAVQKSRETSLSRFIYALGIRHVGEHTAKLLAKNMGTLKRLVGAGREELLKIKEIGPEAAESITGFFSAKENRDILPQLERLGIRLKAESSSPAGRFSGKTFVFTGTIGGMSRRDAKSAVERLGGRASSSVSAKTGFVVAGSSPGSKLDEARALGIKVLTEDEFKKMIDEGNGHPS